MREAVTSTGYNPEFDVDLGRGQSGERLVAGIYTSLFDGRVEVKKDFGAWKTGNHYVETAQQGQDGEWYPSGINRTSAEWWAIVGPDEVGMLVIRTDLLKQLAATAPESSQPIRNEKTNASKGRLVRIESIVAAVVADTFGG
jgi:hypothetical protein